MIINGSGFKYPLNLYSDISAFREEDRERCYYFHKDAGGAELPCDPRETVESILEEHFGGDILPKLIHAVYRDGLSVEQAAGNCGVTADRAEQRIIKAFRDFNYFPLYRDRLKSGTDDVKNAAYKQQREEYLKMLDADYRIRFGKPLKSTLIHSFVEEGALSGASDDVLKKSGIRDLKALTALTEDELSLVFRNNESGKAEVKRLLEKYSLALFAENKMNN